MTLQRSILWGPLLAATAGILTLGCSTNVPFYRPLADSTDTIFVVNGPMKPQTSFDNATDFGSLFTKYLAGSLQARALSARAVPRGEAPPPTAGLLATADILEMDPGSWNLRFWIGFGAGRATIHAHVSLRDMEGKSLLFEKVYQARSLTWQFRENILRRILAKISRTAARDIGREIRTKGILEHR